MLRDTFERGIAPANRTGVRLPGWLGQGLHINGVIKPPDLNDDKDDDELASADEFDERDHNTIEELFLQIRAQTECERLTEQAVARTCKSFRNSPRKMSAGDLVNIRGLMTDLRPFQVLSMLRPRSTWPMPKIMSWA